MFTWSEFNMNHSVKEEEGADVCLCSPKTQLALKKKENKVKNKQNFIL